MNCSAATKSHHSPEYAVDRERINQLFDLTGRTAIVTGGTRGIGRAIATGLVAAGANVAVASRKADACEEAAKSLGDQVIGVPTHMGDLDAVDNLVARTVDAFGGVDIVINNAANALAQWIGDLTPDGWQKAHDVNVRGPVFLVQAALPHLERSEHAAVVNLISVSAFMYNIRTGMYAGAKAAMWAWTHTMAAELAHKGNGIRVNALAPGPVNTDMMLANGEDALQRSGKATLLGRFAEPEEMVGPALFLVSDASSYMTGQVLVADGGMAAR
jgi:NAD(P)-dependent dehydrogenase (short-subunit alcohol dehydrogenase family)